MKKIIAFLLTVFAVTGCLLQTAEAKYTEDASLYMYYSVLTDDGKEKKKLEDKTFTALKNAFKHEESIQYIAMVLETVENPKAVEKFADEIVKENPESPRAYELKYYAQNILYKPDKEILKNLTTANEMCPDNPKILKLIADVKNKMGDTKGANEALEQMNKNLSTSQLGDKALSEGDTEKAVEYYKKALAEGDNVNEISYKLTAVYVSEQELSSCAPYLKGAILYLDEQVEKYPGEPMLLIRRAQLKKLNGDIDGCNKDVKKAKSAFWGDTRFIDEAVDMIPTIQ